MFTKSALSFRYIYSLLLVFAASSILFAAEETTTPLSELRNVARAQKELTAEERLNGLGLGAGLGAVFDIGGSKRVKTATVDSAGIVRVEHENSVRVGAILETHYLWAMNQATRSDGKPRIFFHGPQVSAILGENIIDGVGVGYMLALRRRNVENPESVTLKSFNLGFGAMIQPSVQTLGKGIEANRPLPTGDQLRYHTGPKPGFYAVFSAGF